MSMLFNIRTVLLLTFTLRLIWMLVIDINPSSDPGIYDEFARSIVEGRGFAYSDGTLTAFWPVGTSAIYALIYFLLGYNYIFIGIFNLFLGLAIVYLSWDIGKHYFDEKTALVAAVILSFWPLLIQFTTILASELIFILLMLISIKIYISQSLHPFLKVFYFGLCVGVACYIRPIMLPILFILPTLDLLQTWNFRRFFFQVIPALLIALIVISPWSYRNTQLFGETTMLSTNFGPNLWMGNNPDSTGAYMAMPDRTFESEKDRAKQLKQEAIEFITNNPAHYMNLALNRLSITFGRETIGVVWNITTLESLLSEKNIFYLKALSTVYWLLALTLSLCGMTLLLINRKWRGIFFPPLVLTAYFVSIPLLTVGQDRYHIPLIPFVAFFAAFALCQLHNRWQNTSTKA